jgi:hypothetical protein
MLGLLQSIARKRAFFCLPGGMIVSYMYLEFTSMDKVTADETA